MINLYETRLTNGYRTILVKERGIESDIELLNDPGRVVHLMNNIFHMDTQAEEFCYMLALNAKNRVLGMFLLSKGTVNASIVNPRDVFVRALLCGAVFIIFVHNHPSGDTLPSMQDKVISKKVKESGELLNIPLLDHIIIGRNDFYSFKEHGML